MIKLLTFLSFTCILWVSFQEKGSSLRYVKQSYRDTIKSIEPTKIVYTSEDSVKCEMILQNALTQKTFKKPVSYRTLAICKAFMNTPYVASTLESANGENLVVNLHELDCTTFLENVVVFENLIQKQKFTFADYCKELQFVRYRNGELAGYASRLHYFSEWILQNEKKGLIKNITQEIGGELLVKKINFMTANKDKYVPLKSDSICKEIKKTEDWMATQKLYFIPKSKVQSIENKIKGGDLIAITTTVEGLDITHVGMAVFQKQRLHLLHASLNGKKVEISAKPLSEYLAGNKFQSGIMVARIVDK